MQRSQRAVVIVPECVRVVRHRELERLYAHYGSDQRVAEELGCSESTVSRAITRAGIQRGVYRESAEIKRLEREIAVLKNASSY